MEKQIERKEVVVEELPGTAVRRNLGLLVYRMVLSSDLMLNLGKVKIQHR